MLFYNNSVYNDTGARARNREEVATAANSHTAHTVTTSCSRATAARPHTAQDYCGCPTAFESSRFTSSRIYKDFKMKLRWFNDIVIKTVVPENAGSLEVLHRLQSRHQPLSVLRAGLVPLFRRLELRQRPARHAALARVALARVTALRRRGEQARAQPLHAVHLLADEVAAPLGAEQVADNDLRKTRNIVSDATVDSSPLPSDCGPTSAALTRLSLHGHA